ncbi:pre-rRNA processing [Coemansia sp. RSA 1933]|nr:pre-rRNA processing [Coemansia sp. RSA 1933]
MGETHVSYAEHTEAAAATAGSPRPPMIGARTSRFSILLDDSVDYAVYRTTYGRQFLQQQPKFDSLRDAEAELECVLHDDTFSQQEMGTASAVMAENVALAIDWYISALVLLFDGDEPFQNPEFLRFGCLFFASPLYENNARLVQRHLVKRTYAELSASPTDRYGDSLWILLAFMHLITDFQNDTYLLCKDSGLFPLLQSLILRTPERHLHVLAMSLMFEIAQAVPLSKPDLVCINDDFLVYLLEYVESMRYAESDMYNNTGTKLVVALNEQFLRPAGRARIQSSARSDEASSPPLSISRSMDFTTLPHSQPAASQTKKPEERQSETTPVVAILARRTDCCKTFTENLVFLLNRETEALTQTLILNMLACILATDSTSDILYTNDMHVLVDILIRDLSNLSEGTHQRLRQAYLRVVCALLRNRLFLAARHRLSDIELCLVNILRQSLIFSQSMVCAASESRRDSVSSSSTRHNSMVSTDFPLLVSGGGTNGRAVDSNRDGSRATSPVSSRSSVVSEETCCPLGQTDDSGVQQSHSQQQSVDAPPKTLRRPAPPPPPPPSPSHGSRPSSSLALSCISQGRRRRVPPPPPPPPPQSSCSSPLRASHLNTVNEGVAMDLPAHRPTTSRRKAPPPPPPPRSRPSSRGYNVPPISGSGIARSPTRARQSVPMPPAILPRRAGKAEPTGLRRQLSVKESVTKYKLRGTRPPPPPPPVSLATTPVSAHGMEPAESKDDSLPNDHLAGMFPEEPATVLVNGLHISEEEDELEEPESPSSAVPDDSVEERRVTRKLVENALRSCHDARHFAVKRSLAAGAPVADRVT